MPGYPETHNVVRLKYAPNQCNEHAVRAFFPGKNSNFYQTIDINKLILVLIFRLKYSSNSFHAYRCTAS